MAVAWRSTGTQASRSSSSTATLTVTQPAGHQAGDILILIAHSYETAGAVAINDPAGWTPISASAAWAVSNRAKTAAWYKIAASSSEPSVSMTTASASFLDAQISAFSGGDGTTPIDANTTWATSGASSASFTCQGITTITDNALIVQFIADVDGNLYGPAPTGYTERSETQSGVGFDFVVATKTKTPAGAEPSGTYTKTSSGTNGGIGLAVALRESGAGPAGPTFVPRIMVT